jgi:hypothetical protein
VREGEKKKEARESGGFQITIPGLLTSPPNSTAGIVEFGGTYKKVFFLYDPPNFWSILG